MKTNNLATNIGKRLLSLRTKRNESQQEFADNVGITRGYLSDLERGERHISIETLVKICMATNTTPNKLLNF